MFTRHHKKKSGHTLQVRVVAPAEGSALLLFQKQTSHRLRRVQNATLPGGRQSGWKVDNPNTNEKQIPPESHLNGNPDKYASFIPDCKSPSGMPPLPPHLHCFPPYLRMFSLSSTSVDPAAMKQIS